MEESEVYGNVLDHELKPKQNVVVEAYHVAYSIPPLVLPLRYYLGNSTTDKNGEFRITYPKNAYGVIGRFKVTNIELKFSESYQPLYTHPVRFFVNQNTTNNFGIIILPSNFVYSDKISHVDWMEIIETYLPDITSGLGEEHLAAIIPEYMDYMQNQKYLKEEKVRENPINYRGIIVPKRPKTQEHKPHKIPWYDDWSENEIG